MSSKLTMTASDWLLLVLLSVLFGGAFYFVEIAVPEIPPLTLAFCRCLIAALFLYVYVRVSGLPFPTGGSIWASLLVLAVMNTVLPFGLVFWGQTHITSSLASILNATAPLSSIVLAHFATTDERMTARRATGVAIGFTGVVIMIGVDALGEVGADVLAQLAILGAAFFYAASGVYGRRFKAYPPSVISVSILALGAAMLVPIIAVVDRPWELPAPSAAAIAATAALGLLSTGLAFLIYFRVLGRAGAVNFQLVAFLIPVSAILLGVGLLGEQLTLSQLVGMTAIAIGLAVIDGRPWRAVKGLFGAAPKEAGR